MQKTDRSLTKMLALVKQQPQLPVFHNTHLPTFKIQNDANTHTILSSEDNV